MSKKLRWGETPWDGLTREELLREVQTMASALVSAQSVMRLAELQGGGSPFWTSMDGSGNRALAKTRVALERHAKAGDENCYRAFFRYADDLLFPVRQGARGSRGWMICDRCKQMTADPINGMAAGEPCRAKPCEGNPMRPLVWADLAVRS